MGTESRWEPENVLEWVVMMVAQHLMPQSCTLKNNYSDKLYMICIYHDTNMITKNN